MRVRVALRSSLLLACGLAACGIWSPAARYVPPAGSDGGDPRGATTLLVLPEDGSDQVIDAIEKARRRLWVEMYMLTDGGALDAILAARANGADVRVLLEPAPYGDATANQAAYAALTQALVDVRWFSVATGLVHAKLLLIDDRALILTLNLTGAGLTRNREYALVDAVEGDVRRAEALWQADAVGAPLASAPAGAAASRVIVAPADARARLTAAVAGARGSIALEVEEISDPGFVDQLIEARGRGVAITIVVPGADRSAATDAAAARLAAEGVEVRGMDGPTLHAKAMVVDDSVAYIGSVNFTRASFDDNREVGAVVVDRAVVMRLGETIRDDAAVGLRL